MPEKPGIGRRRTLRERLRATKPFRVLAARLEARALRIRKRRIAKLEEIITQPSIKSTLFGSLDQRYTATDILKNLKRSGYNITPYGKLLIKLYTAERLSRYFGVRGIERGVRFHSTEAAEIKKRIERQPATERKKLIALLSQLPNKKLQELLRLVV